MPEVHAKLSASGAKKWLNCPLSIVMESQFPDTTSEYAAEGTTAHVLGEAKIRLAMKEITRVQYHRLIKKLEITEDMESYTDDYRDFVIERLNAAKAKTPDAILMLEQTLVYAKWVPGGFGTGDVVIIADGAMEIIDLKYGKGVLVSATENTQMQLYALGAIDEYEYIYDIDKVTMTIYQPRIDNIDSYTVDAATLMEWGDRVVRPLALKAFSIESDCCAGKHCDDGFCKARPVCVAYAEKKQELNKFNFAKPRTLSIDEIPEVLENAKQLAKWAKLVEDYALDQALNHDVKYPGFKIVEGRSNRTYSLPENDIASVLFEKGYAEETVYKKELRKITDMEKQLSKKTFNEILGGYVIKPQGKPTLVPMEDKRPEISTADSAAEDFKNVNV